jgi:hypothetical protein
VDENPSDAERMFGALIAQLLASGTLNLKDISQMAARIDDPELADVMRGYAIEAWSESGGRAKPRLRVVKSIVDPSGNA